jgi:integrase
MGSIYARGSKLWLAYVDVDGKRKLVSSGVDVGREREAEKLLKAIEARISKEREVGLSGAEPSGPVTLARYAEHWLKRRASRVKTVDNERTRLERHALPRLGSMLVADVRPRHIRDLVLELQAAGELAPRTIRHVYGVLHTLFRSAFVDELVTANPCTLEPGVLPQNADKDPEWRSTAIFTRDEVETLISDELILADRRVLYALKALAGLRHGEAAGLRWRHYDAAAEPLGRLTIANSYLQKGTKTGVTRLVPVHPTLAKILAAWKLAGWEDTYGKRPDAEDLIIPSRRMGVRKVEEATHAFRRDLGLVKLRARGGHDLRRTFITLAQVDGARRDLLETITHGPRGNIISVYSSFPWPALCAEVEKLRVSLKAGELVAMPVRLAAVAGGWPPEPATAVATVAARSRDEERSLATPEGFESAETTQPPASSDERERGERWIVVGNAGRRKVSW